MTSPAKDNAVQPWRTQSVLAPEREGDFDKTSGNVVGDTANGVGDFGMIAVDSRGRLVSYIHTKGLWLWDPTFATWALIANPKPGDRPRRGSLHSHRKRVLQNRPASAVGAKEFSRSSRGMPKASGPEQLLLSCAMMQQAERAAMRVPTLHYGV